MNSEKVLCVVFTFSMKLLLTVSSHQCQEWNILQSVSLHCVCSHLVPCMTTLHFSMRNPGDHLSRTTTACIQTSHRPSPVIQLWPPRPSTPTGAHPHPPPHLEQQLKVTSAASAWIISLKHPELGNEQQLAVIFSEMWMIHSFIKLKV